MKKRGTKKLTLHWETLQRLDRIEQVHGGAATGIYQSCKFNSCVAACPGPTTICPE